MSSNLTLLVFCRLFSNSFSLLEAAVSPGADFHMQAQVFTERGFLSGFVLEGEMSGVLYFELSSCQNNIRSKLVGASALIICFACYSLPTQAGSLRGPRVAGKTDDQCTLTGRNATCERGKILLLVPFLILVWPNEPIKKFKLQAIICTPLQVNTKRISEEILVKCSEFLALHAIPGSVMFTC